jgi:hypothetical protein
MAKTPIAPVKPEKVFPPAHLFAKANVPAHSKFAWTADGALELEANRSLRVNLGGKGQLRWAELAPGKAANHERFSFRGGKITLQVNPTICLGAEDGELAEGVRIRAQACVKDAEHQAFVMNREGRVRSSIKHLCMTPRESASNLGAEIVLGACVGEWSRFAHHHGGKLAVRQPQFADLHFNLQGGALDAPLVLWKSAPSNTDSFEWSESGQLRLRGRPVCLVAQGGIVQGSRIVSSRCTDEGKPSPSELFGYDDSRSVIFAKASPDLVFNAEGGAMSPGDRLVLWPARRERRAPTASGGEQEL